MSMPEDMAPEDIASEDLEDLQARERLSPDERDIEAPTADAVEQATPADPSQDPDQGRGGPEIKADVNEYDALEQARTVELDDEFRP
jgi:hypothetical protein